MKEALGEELFNNYMKIKIASGKVTGQQLPIWSTVSIFISSHNGQCELTSIDKCPSFFR